MCFAIFAGNIRCNPTGKFSEFVKCAYLAYFKVVLGDQDKALAPYIVCKEDVKHLRQWTRKDRKSLRFSIPMIWREP